MYLIDASFSCNLACVYCYNQVYRQRGIGLSKPDLVRVEETVRALMSREKRSLCLHGGEPLSWGHEVVEHLLRLSYELTGSSALQTNGVLIDSRYIAMFKRYKTSVGYSFDGPEELNEFRADRETTARIQANLELLLAAGVPTGLIVVLSRANLGTPARREKLKAFLLWCKEKGLSGRLNPVLSPDPQVSPSIAEFVQGYLELADFLEEEGMHLSWSPFRDIVRSLKGEPDVVCVFRPCYPYHTPAGITITGQGEVSVCRKFGDEVLLNTMEMRSIRQDLLAQTECRGCPYFGWACYGGCPASATDFDWRHKDRFCPIWRALFDRYAGYMRRVGAYEARKPGACGSTGSAGHSDGLEHRDGAVRHLDSGPGAAGLRSHSDGVEHLDGGWRHLDSG